MSAARPLVAIESPYSRDVVRNVAYARICVRDSLLRGEAPFAMHLHYPQPGILVDLNPSERALGIECGLAWSARASLTVVYADYGITSGMRIAIDRAHDEGRPVEVRQLGPKLRVAMDHGSALGRWP